MTPNERIILVVLCVAVWILTVALTLHLFLML